MKNIFKSTVATTGLAIFAMFFGSGNLMFPVLAGRDSGVHFGWGMAGFNVTAVLLPLIGLIGIILYNGDYRSFFARLGAIPGFLIIFFCMCVIGPCGAMPRIASFCYSLLEPFIPTLIIPGTTFNAEKGLFFIFLSSLVFLATYNEKYVLKFLGHFLTPIKLLSLGILLFKGLWFLQTYTMSPALADHVFLHGMSIGNQTMDLLGGIFFGAAVVHMLKSSSFDASKSDIKTIAMTGIKAGFIGCSILGIVYYGLGLLGAFYGQAAGTVANKSELFSKITLSILGQHGAFFIALAITISCFSTLLALSLVLAEYLHNEISKGFICYRNSLLLILLTTTLFAYCGLEFIFAYLAPLMDIIYPVLAVITLANIAHKLWGFTYIKTPAFITFALSLFLNWRTIVGLFIA